MNDLLADRDNLLTSEIIDRASSVGLDPFFGKCSRRFARDLTVPNTKKIVHLGKKTSSIIDEQLESFIVRLEAWLPESWIAFDSDEHEDLSSRDKILNLRLPHVVLEQILADIFVSRPYLNSIINGTSFLGAQTKSSKSSKSRRQRKQEDRYIREQSVSQENEKSNDEHHSMPIEKVGNLLACVVAKAIADNSIDSYLIATLILFNFYKKSKTCMLPVGNILASLFEGNSTAVPNPFQGSLLSTKDEGAKSVSCRSEGTADESMAGLQSEAGSTIESNNADIGTETASIVETEVEELSEEEILTHALTTSIRGQYFSRSPHRDQGHNQHTAPIAHANKPVFFTFSPFLEQDFLADLSFGENPDGSQLSMLSIVHVICALLICISGSLDTFCKDCCSPYDNTRFPSLTTPLSFTTSMCTLQLVEANVNCLLSEFRLEDVGDSSNLLPFFFSWSLWVMARLVKCSAYSVSDTVSRGENNWMNSFCDTDISARTALQNLQSCLYEILGFNPKVMLELSAVSDLKIPVNMIPLKLMIVEALVSLYFFEYHDDEVKLLEALLITIRNCPSYKEHHVNKRHMDFLKIFFVHKLCCYAVDYVFISFKQSAFLQNRRIIKILYPDSFDDSLGMQRNGNIESLLLLRLGDADLVIFTSEVESMPMDKLYYGELSLLKVLQQMRLKACTLDSYSEGVNQNDLIFNIRRCPPSLRILNEQRECVHLGPKAWATAIATFGIHPNTGIHEFTVHIEKCDKGHVFVGLVTCDASIDTYVGGDKCGFGMIGTRAGSYITTMPTLLRFD